MIFPSKIVKKNLSCLIVSYAVRRIIYFCQVPNKIHYFFFYNLSLHNNRIIGIQRTNTLNQVISKTGKNKRTLV
jgi:hypothetical protein